MLLGIPAAVNIRHFAAVASYVTVTAAFGNKTALLEVSTRNLFEAALDVD
jgi:hypothetical protein